MIYKTVIINGRPLAPKDYAIYKENRAMQQQVAKAEKQAVKHLAKQAKDKK